MLYGYIHLILQCCLVFLSVISWAGMSVCVCVCVCRCVRVCVCVRGHLVKRCVSDQESEPESLRLMHPPSAIWSLSLVNVVSQFYVLFLHCPPSSFLLLLLLLLLTLFLALSLSLSLLCTVQIKVLRFIYFLFAVMFRGWGGGGWGVNQRNESSPSLCHLNRTLCSGSAQW